MAAGIVQLTATGLLIEAADLEKRVAHLLDPELVNSLKTPLPTRPSGAIAWDQRSVHQRRLVMRAHATAFADAARPSVSAILVSRRPERISAAVMAMATQSYPNLEIVVATHGFDLPPRPLRELGRPLHLISVPAERNLGEALALATEASSGILITKVDDDDLYGPDHVWDLVAAREYSHATVVGKGAEFVYLRDLNRTVRRIMGSEFFTSVVAGGTIMVGRADLHEAGGWPGVPKSVDRGLLDRVIAAGGRVYRTHPYGFVYVRHGDGHTWNPGDDYFLRNVRDSWTGLPPLEGIAA